MINIRQSQTNTVSISSLESLVTIPNPVFIFKWVDSYNYTFIKSFLDQSAYPERYSEFIVTDGSDLTFKASGHCYIYESPVDASAIDPSTMNLLTSEQYTFIPIAIADYVYEPSLYTYNAVDTVFDPQFNTNTPSPTYIFHDDLSGRTNPDNHPQYIKEASLGSDFLWNNGVLDVSVEGGSSIQDPSIVDLYNYTLDLSTRLDNFDPAQDASISDLYSKKADKTEIYSKTYIDGSLNAKQPAGTYLGPNDAFTSAYNESGDAKIFNSITPPYLGARSINASEGIQLIETANEIYIGVNSTIARTFQLSGLASETYVQQSLYPYATNASIGSAGFAKQDYVDASLNAKQDLIPEGTYIKESSLGDDFYWNGGLLEVSVGTATSQDPSIVDLYETAIFGTASSGTGEVLLNVTQLPGELAAIKCSTLTAGTGVTFDISYGGVFGTDVDNITINASVGAIGKDPSIDDLYAVKADKTYVDGSLSQRDTSVAWLNTNKVNISAVSGDNTSTIDNGGTYLDLYVYDAGDDTYGDIVITKNQIEIMAGDLNPELAIKPNLIEATALIKYIGNYSSSYDDRTLVDKEYVSSLVNAKVNQTLFDTSIASLTGWNLSQDASLILKADKTYVDASLNAKQDIIPAGTYVKEASLGDGLVWNGGLLDVSVEGGSGTSSLSGLSDVSISSLSDKDALIYDSSNAKWINVPTTDISSLYAPRLTYFTTVNASTYLVNPSDNLNIIQCDTSTVITFPDTLEAGFSTTVMLNVSTGYVTLNASTFRATDASIRLKDMYAAATVVHKGSGVFYGFGNLK